VSLFVDEEVAGSLLVVKRYMMMAGYGKSSFVPVQGCGIVHIVLQKGGRVRRRE